MAKPDLSTAEGLRAYRAELWRVARWWRWVGLGLVVLATIGFVLTSKYHMPLLGSPLGLATVAGLVAGDRRNRQAHPLSQGADGGTGA